jgi:hypothetical protein
MNFRLFATVPLLLWTMALASGQSPALPTVIGRGQAEVKKDPELLRMQVEIVVRGKDLKDALDRLKERRGELVKKLAELEALKDSAEFGAPTVTGDKSSRQLQIERMMIDRGRFPSPVRQPVKPKQPDPVFVAVSLKADWTLSGSPEELLLRTQTLQEKIKAADLGGLKALEGQASPAEIEVQEELRGMNREEGPKRGEPTFLFVARIKDAERVQGLARAYQSAREHAERSARSANAALGALLHLDSEMQAAAGADPSADDPYRYLQRYRGWGGENPPELPKGEVVGTHPGRLAFRFSVSASFALK